MRDTLESALQSHEPCEYVGTIDRPKIGRDLTEILGERKTKREYRSRSVVRSGALRARDSAAHVLHAHPQGRGAPPRAARARHVGISVHNRSID